MDEWSSDDWRAAAVAWIDAALERRGIQRVGPVEQTRVRPWATTLRAPTSQGPVWLKAAGPATSFEAPLYRLLSQRAPRHVLAPLALDDARGWMLLPDGGTTLEGLDAGGALEAQLGQSLVAYARLQRELMQHSAELVALGVPDMRPARMPARLEEALIIADRRASQSSTAEERAALLRVCARRGLYERWCRELAASPIAVSLDHNDLHPGNIFAAAGSEPKIYDWGDSVVAHPFASLLVALGYLRHRLGVAQDDPRIEHVRDLYLGELAELLPRAEQLRTVELACHVGKVARALTWARALADVRPEDAGAHAGAPLRWVCALLDPAHILAGG